MLAGVSVEYLTRIEQGRDRRPSPQVLAALADALRLSAADRSTLLHATKAESGTLCARPGPPADTVRPTVRALLERLEPAPAVLLNRLSDVLATTTGFERLAGPVGILDEEPPNLVRFVFTDHRARAVFPDWDAIADTWVASLKVGPVGTDAHLTAFADELAVLAGGAFTGRFDSPLPSAARSGFERMVHPEVGHLLLAFETLALPDAESQRLVVYLPGDPATAKALDQLTGLQPGALRVVGG